MLSKTLELLGAVCVVAFCYIVWVPLALLPVAALLIFAGYLTADVHIGFRKSTEEARK